ncbi:MAG: phage shock protein A [Candidatus Reconcilbacillus cellulovorans]|uniref:Phage shock protein A n=1 Tax=Candidatus Reconcilbacillus cellulovorans TaxID=1906605 RepID=A0A2A6DYL0_9BACL|nr:MAG: phage shock protein A [Candidatus Reconcilbacillus cellulovorans]
MSVFRRIGDLTKATVHEILDKLEDPVMMLNQYLRDMEDEIARAEVTAAKQMAAERKLNEQKSEAERRVGQCEAEAERALLAGDEPAARAALERKLYFQSRAAELANWREEARKRSEELLRQLREMKEDYYRMRHKRNELAARAQMAQARKQMAEFGAAHAFEAGTAARGFQRIEEKILRMEAEADIAASPFAAPGYAVSPAASPFVGTPQAQDERRERVEEELRALKAKLNGDA